MIDALFSRTINLMQKSMDLRMVRQGYLASNVANAETPNYRAIDIDFKATMAQLVDKMPEAPMELLRSEPEHFRLDGVTQAEAEKKRVIFAAADDSSIGNDSNSVNLEAETAKLQENALMYSTTTQLLAKKLRGLSGVIESSARY